MRVHKRLVFFLLRLGVACGLLFFILNQFDVQKISSLLQAAEIWWFVPAVFAQLASSIVAALRWRLVMPHLGFSEHTLFYLSSYLKAVLFNQGLPSSVGGDALRVIDLIRLGYGKRQSFSSVLLDRIIGISGLLIPAIGAAHFIAHPFPETISWLITLLCAGLLAVIAAIAVVGAIAPLRHSRLSRLTVVDPLWIVSDNLRLVLRSPVILCAQLGLASITHLWTIVAFVAIGEALHIDIDFASYCVFVPALILFSLIPVSLAGWGLRETGAIALLGMIGIPAEESFAMSVSYGLVLLVTVVPGLLLFLKRSPRKQTVILRK